MPEILAPGVPAFYENAAFTDVVDTYNVRGDVVFIQVSDGDENDKLKSNLPAALRPFEGTAKLADYQLRVALEYLNQVAGGPTRNTARASGGGQ